MSSQSVINETLKQINVILQGYASHFAQQGKAMAEIKFSVDQLNDKMGNITAEFQEIDMHFDVMDLRCTNLRCKVPLLPKMLQNMNLNPLQKL